MPQPIRITIPTPCTQKWDDMEPSGTGRYCKHCSKTVIDFTSFTDAELYRYFSNNRQVCGMFFASQLERDIVPAQPQSKLYRLFIAMGLTLMFTQLPAAHARLPVSPFIQTMYPGDDTGTAQSHNLSATVKDTTGHPIVNVTVQVFSNGKLIQTMMSDSTGFVSAALLAGKYMLVLRHSSYATLPDTAVVITKGETKSLSYTMIWKRYETTFPDITIDRSKMLIMGGPWSSEIPPIEKYINKKKIKRRK